MRIAIIHHSEDTSNDYGAFISSLLQNVLAEKKYVAADYHQVLREKSLPGSADLLLHIVIPASGKWGLNHWYKRKLPRIFKNMKIDVIICSYGICTLSNIPQILIIPDTSLLLSDKPAFLWQQYAARRIKKNLDAAKNIITYSQQSKQIIPQQKTVVIPYTTKDLFQPLEWHDKLYIKSRFAENKEFFISIIPDNNEKIFVELLKAFSKFKKSQQSSMQLLLLPKEDSFTRRIDNKLDTYKYRNDVKLINDADEKETAQIIASAYAYLHIPENDADLLPVVIAMKSALPVVGYYTDSMYEYCGDTAILIKEQSFDLLGEELIRIYKDESLRTKLCELAVSKTASYQQAETADQVCKILDIP